LFVFWGVWVFFGFPWEELVRECIFAFSRISFILMTPVIVHVCYPGGRRRPTPSSPSFFRRPALESIWDVFFLHPPIAFPFVVVSTKLTGSHLAALAGQ